MHRFSFSSPATTRRPAASSLLRSGRVVIRTLGDDVLPWMAASGGQPGQYRLIYLAIAAQLVNMTLAIYLTSFLRFGDVLLDVFGRWDLALISKCLAFGAWLLLRDRPAARLAAWIIAPLSLLALLHDLLLLIP